MIVQPTDTLYLVVEASLALAGFAGVVTALTQRSASELSPILRLRLINLLATSLGALFASLTALTLLAAGVDGSTCWRILSGVSVLIGPFFMLRSLRLVLAKRRQADQAPSLLPLGLVFVPLIGIYGLQVWNALGPGEFWPFLLMLVSLFAVGCGSFVGLLLPLRSGSE